jgi:hypothetical protein
MPTRDGTHAPACSGVNRVALARVPRAVSLPASVRALCDARAGEGSYAIHHHRPGEDGRESEACGPPITVTGLPQPQALLLGP